MRTARRIVFYVMILCLGFVCTKESVAAETEAWLIAIATETGTLSVELAALQKVRPPALVAELLQKSDACYAGFVKHYDNPKFNLIGEGQILPGVGEQIGLAKAMVAHELICLELIFRTVKRSAELPVVAAYEKRIKEREKKLDQVDFELSEFDLDLAYLLFTYRALLRGVREESGQLQRVREYP